MAPCIQTLMGGCAPPTFSPTAVPVPAPTPIPKEDCADSTTWYYEKESRTCDAYVAKKTKNCKLKDEFKAAEARRKAHEERQLRKPKK